MNRSESAKSHYLIICVYGIILLALMVGAGNLFGSEMDWLAQHIVFPDAFRRSFYQSGQLIPDFMFNVGGGQNAFNFTYYGFLSPVILISYLLPFVDMTTYMIIASIVLYLMTGIFAYIFLKHHFSEKRALVASIIFITLSPVNFHFHRHIMFVWYLPFLMLGLIGLDRYFEKKKRVLFIVSVFCMILTNYLFSVGSLVCLFVYAVYRMLQREEMTLGKLFKKIWSVVYLFMIPVLLSAFILLPTAYALFSNSRSNEVTESIRNLIIPNLLDSLWGHYSTGITGLMLIAAIGNLTCKRFKKCEAFLNGFLIVVIVCPIVSYVLNGMLYVRGKALIPFAILYIYAYCMFMDKLEKREIRLKQMAGFVTLFVIVCCLIRTQNVWAGVSILGALALVFLCRMKPRILYIFTIAALLVASFVNNKKEQYVSVEFYEKMYNREIEELMEYAEDDWYRTNVAYMEEHTGNRMYGSKFNGSSIYSSTSNSLYQEFYETYMGNNEKYRNCFIVCGARNELFYTFMGTRYIIAENDPGLYYEKVAEGEHLNLYENKEAYPVVYKSGRIMGEDDFDKTEFPYSAEYLMNYTVVESGDSADNQSLIEQCNVAEDYRFVQEETEKYTIQLDESYRNRLLYLTFDIVNEGQYQNKKDISITINDIENTLTAYTWRYYNGNTTFDYVIPLENTNNLTVEITKGAYDIKNLHMYTSPIIKNEYSAVDNLEIDTFSGEISFTTNAEEGEYLVTSIPYDKGFTTYINDEQVTTEVVNKAFVGAKLSNGENKVVIKYTAPFFHAGIAISLVGLVLFLYEISKNIVKKLTFKGENTNENISCDTVL